MNTRKPDLRDYGVTTKQYERYIALQEHHLRYETRCEITKDIILAIVSIGFGVFLSIVGGWGFGVFFGIGAIALIAETAIFQFRKRFLLRARVISQIKLYEGEVELYRMVEEEDERARQETERVQQEAERTKERAERARRRRLRDFWMSLSGTEFERELATLYKQLGYQVQSTPTTGDEGVDLIIRKDGKKTVVQCKGYQDPVGPAIVRELFGSMIHSNADSAILACTGGFTKGVVEFAEGKPIELISASEMALMSDGQDYNDQSTTPSKPICPSPECGREMRLQQGKYGSFWGCPAYPSCKGTRQVWKF